MATVAVQPHHLYLAMAMRRRQMQWLPWRDWLARHFAHSMTAPFAERHVRFWEWVAALEPGVRPRSRVEVWGRGSGKSTTLESGVAYLGAEPQPRRHYVLYCSETQAQANRHVQAVASMLERVGVKRALNEYGASKGWRHTEIRTANGFNVTAFGLDSGMRGVKLDEFRPDVIVFDDIDSRHDTAETTRKKIEVITTTVLPAGSTDCAVIVVQNKVAADSIVSQLCDGRADFLHDRLPATVEPAVRDLQYERVIRDDGTPRYVITGGEATWAGQDLATCEQQMNQWGLGAFLREAQHDVLDTEGSIIKRHWLNQYAQRPPTAPLTIQSWDTAFKDGVDNDYSVCSTFAYGPNGAYLLDVYRDRIQYPDLERMAVQQRNRWRPAAVLIEDKASGQSLIQSLRRNTDVPVIAIPVTKDKAQRVNEVSPGIEAGRLLLPETAPWLDDVILELTTFPNAAHDDVVDSISQALAWLFNRDLDDRDTGHSWLPDDTDDDEDDPAWLN